MSQHLCFPISPMGGIRILRRPAEMEQLVQGRGLGPLASLSHHARGPSSHCLLWSVNCQEKEGEPRSLPGQNVGCGRAPLGAKEACRLTTMAKLHSAPSRSSLISPTTRSLYAQLPRTAFPTNKPKT